MWGRWFRGRLDLQLVLRWVRSTVYRWRHVYNMHFPVIFGYFYNIFVLVIHLCAAKQTVSGIIYIVQVIIISAWLEFNNYRWTKKRGHSAFCRIDSRTLPKIFIQFFGTHQGSCILSMFIHIRFINFISYARLFCAPNADRHYSFTAALSSGKRFTRWRHFTWVNSHTTDIFTIHWPWYMRKII